jgi:hypothetical protein
MNGCEYAKALVTCGGVASNRGDFWCTRIVDLCRVEGNECEVGEKAATVGGLVVLDSFLSGAEWPAFADVDDVSDMELIQGVSVVQDMLVRASSGLPGCCPERLYHQNMSSLHFCGETKTQKAMEIAPEITHTKGCHETALYIGLLPQNLGIPPHSLDTRRRRIHSARLRHAAQDPDNEHDPFRHCM